MKKIIFPLAIILLLFASSCKKSSTCDNGIKDGDEEQVDCGGSDCPPCCVATGGVFTGDVDLLTQAQVDSFGSFHYEEVIGMINISGSSIQSLSSLCSLTKVRVLFLGSSAILNLDGLQNLTELDELYLFDLDNIANINELSGVQFPSFSFIEVSFCQNLENLNGLSISNSSIFQLVIINNPSLTDITSLNNVMVENYFTLNNFSFLNASMPSVSFINGVNVILNNNVGDFSLPALLSLDSISDISIYNNPDLTNLDFLQNIEATVFFNVSDNSSLMDLCGITNLVQGGTIQLNGTKNNGYNPTTQDILNGDCAM